MTTPVAEAIQALVEPRSAGAAVGGPWDDGHMRATVSPALVGRDADLDALRDAVDAGDGHQLLGVFTRARVAREHFSKILARRAYMETAVSADGVVFVTSPGGRLSGRIRVPGDKSISHRSIMLGSLAEADDAVQETWIRLNRSDAGEVENLGGWLTTVVGRVALDMLRSRRTRREEPLGVHLLQPDAIGLVRGLDVDLSDGEHRLGQVHGQDARIRVGPAKLDGDPRRAGADVADRPAPAWSVGGEEIGDEPGVDGGVVHGVVFGRLIGRLHHLGFEHAGDHGAGPQR